MGSATHGEMREGDTRLSMMLCERTDVLARFSLGEVSADLHVRRGRWLGCEDEGQVLARVGVG
jgi:hypothetical protein